MCIDLKDCWWDRIKHSQDPRYWKLHRWNKRKLQRHHPHVHLILYNSYFRLRVFNNTARYVDQGGNKRPGAFACYLEPWHADIFDFLDLKKNTGKEESRARDLFYALWIPDLFMKRVEENGDWSLFCPAEAPGMDDVWGEKFEQLYHMYEAKGTTTVTP